MSVTLPSSRRLILPVGDSLLCPAFLPLSHTQQPLIRHRRLFTPTRSAAMLIEEGVDNHYQDIEKIGEGGFGTVFRAVSRLNGEASPPVTHHD
jgi:serine/threonine protein kinase